MEAEEINKFIDNFKEIYQNNKEENPLPDGVKLTVWCSNDDDTQGFAYNVTSDELGLEILIAKKWILQGELEQLYANSNNK